MRYAAKIAIRHLLSSPGQTVLLITGVGLGVTVFIFMSALIGGLATLLTQRTVGSIAHVTLEMRDRDPAALSGLAGAQVAVQKDLSRREQIGIWQPFIPIIDSTPGVTGLSPQIRGSAFVERGQAIAPVGVVGVIPGKLSVIADIGGAIVSGSGDLPVNAVLTWQVRAREEGGVEIVQTFDVGGGAETTGQLAGPVDGVMSEGMQRLERYLETGSAD